MKIDLGFDDSERPRIAALYWAAFGSKLGRLLGPEDKARAYVAAALSPQHAFCARDGSGAILGVAGFKSPQGALVDSRFDDLAAHYGRLGALWRIAAFSALGSEVDNRRFLVDGLFVDAPFRGRGVGTRLLEAIAEEAWTRGYDAVRLDVIDTNIRARNLYRRRGFEPVARNRTGPLAMLFGFTSATVMVRRLR